MAVCTIILPDGQTDLPFDPPEKLSRLLERAGAQTDMPCGGRGKCGKCRVGAEGALSPRAEAELFLPGGERLACVSCATGDVILRVRKNAGDVIVTDGAFPAVALSPLMNGLGCAVDIGTTTVAAYLYDLSTGSRLSVASCPNPQSSFGADVLSRIGKSMDGCGAALSSCVTEAIRGLLSRLASDAGKTPADVSTLVITGNTAMLYLLTGRSPASIASVPFQPDSYFGEWVSPAPFGIAQGGVVYLSRSVSAYVGADITCSMLAAGFARDTGKTEPCLMADIGTNGEMALRHGDRIYCCSTAAGPAFEGAGIYRGMNAREGAITGVRLDGGALRLDVIGDKPTGICGSGIVDAVACLLRAGVIDETGRIQDAGHNYMDCLTRVNGQIAFRLPETDVELTQADIRAVQLAKSALCAGMLTLIQRAGLAPEQVPRLLIAGGFGSCIRPESAEVIGLIPPGFAEKSRQIGNAAGAGASMILLSRAEQSESERLSRSCDVVELSTDPFFMDAYIDSMSFE